jgi:hypothetical protein
VPTVPSMAPRRVAALCSLICSAVRIFMANLTRSFYAFKLSSSRPLRARTVTVIIGSFVPLVRDVLERLVVSIDNIYIHQGRLRKEPEFVPEWLQKNTLLLNPNGDWCYLYVLL